MHDFIGDIHGHADKLVSLLTKLGYKIKDGAYQHPDRTAFFLGDFIDRGPDSPGVVSLVRAMVEAGHAKAIMGNHEYNAILYNTKVGTNFLRRHSNKNNKQHRATLNQYADYPKAYEEAIAWFKTLPLFYDDENFRAIHACWHMPSLEILKRETKAGCLSESSILAANFKQSSFYKAVETGLKGLEIHLPNGISFEDKDGHKRQAMRVKWWIEPKNKTLKEMSVLDDIELPQLAFDKQFEAYPSKAKSVFLGHYWLQGTPVLQQPNVCCLDYSVAKEGKLCAYRWHGEKILSPANLIYV